MTQANSMKIGAKLEEINAQFESGHPTKDSYLPALCQLFLSINSTPTVAKELKSATLGMPNCQLARDGSSL